MIGDVSYRRGNWKGEYLDSGATSHMKKDVSILAEFNGSNATIRLADGKHISSAGVGSVLFCEVNDEDARVKVNLNNVLQVPTLAGNLLSVRP